jgi:hypothetical protein
MPRSRQSHATKTPTDREEYYENTIRGTGPSPTVETARLDNIDSTAAAKPVGGIETTGRYRPTYQPSGLAKLLREKGLELLIAALIIPLLLWMGYQLYTLNRELGELKVELGGMKAREERKQSELDRLNDRLDRLSQPTK